MSNDNIIGYITPYLDVWLLIIESSNKIELTLMDIFPEKLPITDILFKSLLIPESSSPYYHSMRYEDVECYEVIYQEKRFILWPHDIDEIEIKRDYNV